MMPTATTWRLTVTVDGDAADAFEVILEPFCVATSRFIVGEGPLWRVEGDCVAAPDPDALRAAVETAAEIAGVPVPDLRCCPVAARDWVVETRRAFPPIAVGRYFIYGTHFEGAVPRGRIGIRLDAGAAFGSGQHATTAGCLTAMARIARRRRPDGILDMGCGSGILAIAAARTWRRRVVAVDNDPLAVEVARDNARRNGVSDRVRVGFGDGYAAPVARGRREYGLILANILARPLRAMARDLRARLARGGYAVLSGFIETDARRVLSAHEALGLRLHGHILREGWVTLVLRRP